MNRKGNEHKRASIKDVARLAKVSVASVSNVINRKMSVGEDIYQRVQDAIKELNYTPNLMAKSLRTNKAKFIGLILPACDGIYSAILDGVTQVIRTNEYHLVVGITHDFPDAEERTLNDFISLGVNGIAAL